MGYLEQQEYSRLEAENKQDLMDIEKYKESVAKMVEDINYEPLFTTPVLSPGEYDIIKEPTIKEKKGLFRKIMDKLVNAVGYGKE